MAWGSCFSPDFRVAPILGAAAGTTALNDRRVVEGVGATAATFVLGGIDSGRYSARFDLNAAASNIELSPMSSAGRYSGLLTRFKIETTGVTYNVATALASNAADNIHVRIQSDGTLRYTFSNNVTVVNTGIQVAIGQVYRLELFVDWNTGTTHTVKIRLDGVEIVNATGGVGIVTAANLQYGDSGLAAGMAQQHADMVSYNDPAQYGLMNDWRVLGVEPVLDGIHSMTANDFQNEAATNLTNASTGTFVKVNDAPTAAPATTTFVQQVVLRATSYMEWQLRPIFGDYGDPVLVNLAAAMHPVGAATPNTSQFRLNANGDVSTEAIVDTTLTSNTLEYRKHHYPTKPSGGAWTLRDVQNLGARFGLSNDATPAPALDAIMAFVVVPVQPPTARSYGHLFRNRQGKIGLAKFQTTRDKLGEWKSFGGFVTSPPQPRTVIVGQAESVESALAATHSKGKNVSQATETDTGLAATHSKAASVNQATETDSGLAASHSRGKNAAQATETDSGLASTIGKGKSVSQATETDSGLAASHSKTKTVAQATEADTGLTASHSKTSVETQAIESDSALAATVLRTKIVAQATEADSALAASHAKAVTVGQAIETATGLAASHSKAATVGQAAETDTALAATALRTKSVSQATETDSGLAASPSRAKTTGQATETDSAIAAAHARATTVDQATETDTGLTASHSKTNVETQAIESDSALPATALRTKSVSQATETDSALPASHSKTVEVSQASDSSSALAATALHTRAVSQATEADSALPASHARAYVVGQATTTDTGMAATVRRTAHVGQATSTDAAQSAVATKAGQEGIAIEVDTALPATAKRTLHVGQAQETDSALPASHARAVTVAQASESNDSLAASHSKTVRVGQAGETDQAFHATTPGRTPVDQASETDTALSVTILKTVVVGQATEDTEALSATPVQTALVMGQATETDAAMPATAILGSTPLPPPAPSGGGTSYPVRPMPKFRERPKFETQVAVGMASEASVAMSCTPVTGVTTTGPTPLAGGEMIPADDWMALAILGML